MSKASPNHDDSESGTPNESTRLLSCGDEEVASRSQVATPLPKAQLAAIVAIRLVEPVAYLQIFPYINQLLVDARIAEPDRVGFYSGLVESVYPLAEVFSVYQLGRISDVVGRRPVVFTTLIAAALASTAFGLSTSFAGMIVFRFCGGLVAGNAAVINSILVEITDDTNRDLAIPIDSLSLPLSAIIGPLIGGTLGNAAMRYPLLFSWHIFVEHPYLPPCIASAACALVAALLGYILIGETLPGKRKDDHHADTRAPSASESHVDPGSNEAKPASVLELLSIPAIRALTISGFALGFLSSSFDAVFTLFCYTPIDAGGLGLQPSTIGNTFAISGMISILLRFSAMPYILRHFNCAKAYNTCMHFWSFAFGLLPFINPLMRTYMPPGATALSITSAFVWTCLFSLVALARIGEFPFSLNLLLVEQHAPSPASLGRSNGLVQFALCTGSAIAPVFVSALFTGINGAAWAKQWGVGWLWAVVMVVGAIAGARVTGQLGSYSCR